MCFVQQHHKECVVGVLRRVRCVVLVAHLLLLIGIVLLVSRNPKGDSIRYAKSAVPRTVIGREVIRPNGDRVGIGVSGGILAFCQVVKVGLASRVICAFVDTSTLEAVWTSNGELGVSGGEFVKANYLVEPGQKRKALTSRILAAAEEAAK